MSILHVIPDEKFTTPYINFINKNFEEKNHTFLIIDKKFNGFSFSQENTKILTGGINDYYKLLRNIIIHEKVILHGLFFYKVIILLFIMPFFSKKCYWAIWGGDLYVYKKNKKKIKSKIYEAMRRFVISRIGGLITHIQGDYYLSTNWYNARGKYYYSFMYPSNLYNEYKVNDYKRSSDSVFIQVGNSADPTNNHLELFERLEPFKNENIIIVCPLSYGNKDHAKTVKIAGQRIFGEKFQPITEFMPFEEYLKLLSNIDIALFNHDRQQAVGNITTLIGMGKKVYIRDDITTWDFCLKHNLKVFNLNKDFTDLFTPMANETKLNNMQLVKSQFSEQKLISDWNKIFEGGI